MDKKHISTANSSHGTVVFNNITGKVISINETTKDLEPGRSYLGPITKIDVDEFRKYYNEDLPEFLDILDIGYWVESGQYEEPCNDWREEIKAKFWDNPVVIYVP